MTKITRQVFTDYGKPLCEEVVDAPEPKGTEVLVRVGDRRVHRLQHHRVLALAQARTRVESVHDQDG